MRLHSCKGWGWERIFSAGAQLFSLLLGLLGFSLAAKGHREDPPTSSLSQQGLGDHVPHPMVPVE